MTYDLDFSDLYADGYSPTVKSLPTSLESVDAPELSNKDDISQGAQKLDFSDLYADEVQQDDLSQDSFAPDYAAQAKANMELAQGQDPDAIALAKRREQESGLPFNVTYGLDDVPAQSSIEAYSFLCGPMQQYMAQSPAHAAMVQDDVSVLDRLARNWNFYSRKVDLITTAYQRGELETEYAKLATQKYVYGMATEQDLQRFEDLRLVLGKKEASAEELASRGLTLVPQAVPQSPLEESLVGSSGMVAQMVDTTKKGLGTGLMYSIGFAGSAALMGQLGPQVALPEEVITVPAAALTGFVTGMKLGSAQNMFELEAGNMADELSGLRDENGVPMDPEIVRWASVGVGVVNAAIEFAQVKGMAQFLGLDKLTSTAVKEALRNPTMRDALFSLAKRYSGRVAKDTVMEIVQEAVSMQGGELAKIFASEPNAEFAPMTGEEKLARLKEAGRSALLIFPLMHMPGASVRLMSDVANVQRGRTTSERLLAASEAADESTFKKRSPEEFESFVQNAMPENEVTQYLDTEEVKVFAQSMKATLNETLERMGIEEAAFVEAEATGQTVAVSAPRIVAQYESSESAPLIQALRVEPTAMNAKEAEAFDPISRMQGLLKEGKARQKEYSKQVQTGIGREVRRITGELMHTGMPRNMARGHADFYAAQAHATAQRFGVPEFEQELLARNSFRMEDAPVEGVTRDASGAIFPQSMKPEKSSLEQDIESLPNAKGGSPEGEQQVERVRLAEEVLQRDVSAWAENVDAIVASGKKPSQAVKMLGQTPLVLDLLGTDTVTGRAAAQGGIHVASHVFDGSHMNMTPDMWKQMPAAMADPIAIFDTDSPNMRKQGNVVFMLEIKDAQGATMVVPVALQAKGKLHGVEMNIVKSAYTKENEGVPSNTWFKKQAQKNARYINEQKIKRWQERAGVYFPFTSLLNASGNKIYTDADLVNLKSLNPTYYQNKESNRGQVELGSQKNIITLFRGKADLSTVLHEAGHIFLDDMLRLVEGGQVEMAARASFAKALEPFGPLGEELGIIELMPDAILNAKDNDGVSVGIEGAYQEVDYLHDHGMINAKQKRVLRSAVRKMASQAKAIRQAQEDLNTLREHAGLAEGEVFSEDAHEHMARSFEAYLREGTSPSAKLTKLFENFRKWLTQIYSSVRELNVELSDEVRLVFDRMLATDAAIAQNEVLSSILDGEYTALDEMIRGDMSGNNALDAADARTLEDALAEAERQVHAEMDRLTLKDRQQRIKEYNKEAKSIVESDPFWSMVDSLAKGNGLHRDELALLYGPEPVKELTKRRPGLVRTKKADNAQDIDEVAQEMGYADADTLWEDLYGRLVLNGESKGKTIQNMAESLLDADDATTDPVQLFIAGDAYGAYIQRVEEILWKKATGKKFRNPEQQARYLDSIRVAQSIIRDQARAELRFEAIADLNPSKQHAAIRKALADRREAWRKGDAVGEVRAVDKLRMATERSSAVYEAQRRVESIVSHARKLGGMKRGLMNEDCYEHILHLVHRYGLGTASMRPRSFQTTILPLRDIIANADSGLDLAPSFSKWLIDGTAPSERQVPGQDGRLKYQYLNLAQLDEVDNLLSHLEHLGRKERQDSVEEYRRRVESTVDACLAPLQTLTSKTVQKVDTARRLVSDKVDTFLAGQEAFAWMMRAADAYTSTGDKGVQGPHEQAILAPLQKQEDDYARRTDAFAKEIQPCLHYFRNRTKAWAKEYGSKMNILVDGKPMEIPSLLRSDGHTHLTGEQIIAMALNLGNKENAARLFSGFADMTPETVLRLFGTPFIPVLQEQQTKNALRQMARLKNVREPNEMERGVTSTLVKMASGKAEPTKEQMAELYQIANENPAGMLDGEALKAVQSVTRLDTMAKESVLNAKQGKNGQPLFTVEDWEQVQKVWDSINALFPDLDATHKRINGFALTKVQAQGFMIPAKGGARFFRGGYYPARYDGKLAVSARVREWTESDEILNRNEAMYQTPAAKSGMTKERASSAPSLPLLLSLSVLTEHAHDVIRYTSHAEAVRFADRVLQNQAYEKEFTRVFGHAMFDSLRPALKYTIRPKGTTQRTLSDSSIAWAVSKARPMMVAYGLGYRLKTAASQVVAIFPAAHDLGWKWFAKGCIEALCQNPMENMKRIRELSPYMARRAYNVDSTIAAMRDSVGHKNWTVEIDGQLYTWEDVVNLGLLPISVVDVATTYPIWLGAYKKHIAETGDAEGAVTFADDIVRRTNPDADPISKSDWLRSDQTLIKMINVFQSSAQQVAQRQRYHWRGMRQGKISKGQWGWYQLHDAVLPALGTWFIQCALFNDWGDDDKEDGDWTMRMLAHSIEFAYSPLIPVIAKDAMQLPARLVDDDFGKEFISRGGQTVLGPIGSVWNSLAKSAGAIRKNGIDDSESLEELAMSVADAVSLFARVPVSRVARDMARGYEQWESGEGTMLSPFAPRPRGL
ncbi:MAG: hypothetical protein R3Y11_03940 [Pseudomonadota bacterium]